VFRAGILKARLDATGKITDQPVWTIQPAPRGETQSLLLAGNQLVLTYTDNDESILQMYSSEDGSLRGAFTLSGNVIKDGVAAAYGKLFLSMEDGKVFCLGKEP
jgi:hypothetical protein